MSDSDKLLDELFPQDEQQDSVMLKIAAAATKQYDHDKLVDSVKIVSEKIGKPGMKVTDFLIILFLFVYLPVVLCIVGLFYTISGTAAILVLLFFLIFLLLAYIHLQDYIESLNDYIDKITVEGPSAAKEALDNYLSVDK